MSHNCISALSSIVAYVLSNDDGTGRFGDTQVSAVSTGCAGGSGGNACDPRMCAGMYPVYGWDPQSLNIDVWESNIPNEFGGFCEACLGTGGLRLVP